MYSIGEISWNRKQGIGLKSTKMFNKMFYGVLFQILLSLIFNSNRTKMNFEGKEYTTYSIPTTNTFVLIIGAEKGFFGCGYINVEVANKVGDVCAIVTGVKTTEDMLSAKVVSVSEAGKQLGIKEGMTGKEALFFMS